MRNRKFWSLMLVALLLVATAALVQAATFVTNTTPGDVPSCTDNGFGDCIWEFTAQSDTVPGDEVCIEVHPVGDAGNYIRQQCTFAGGTGPFDFTCTVNVTANPAFANATVEYQFFNINGTGCEFPNGFNNTGFNWQFSSGPNAIELAAFDASVSGNAVTLTWETASEIDHAGFNLLRGTDAAGSDRQAINGGLIAAQGSQGLGAAYIYLDQNVTAGRYYYWLQALDTTGGSSLHGPAQVEVRVPTAVALSGVAAGGNNALWAVAALALVALLSGYALLTRRQRAAYRAPQINTLATDDLATQLGPARALTPRRWEADLLEQ